jgi:ribonuclease P protein subunit POP4
MSVTRNNIHKHELIGLNIRIVSSSDKRWNGISAKIVDETKNTFKIDIMGKEKVLQKKETVFTIKIGKEEVNLDASRITFRPEDRIKKARKKAVT